ncbi:MAG: protease SohB [Candidatus Endonucleobacter bathymodioli]|uniref:Protease SohB n=1 Tax=Candidatus Endonucleibacter bathymodioli TaxID=539814 RepID=A0AA90NIU9_9GAMM|nr:protease SohB [Candidatus Endonucleobacter bathymodioli]
MEYILEFALFLAKTITLIGGLLLLISAVALLGQKTKKMYKGHLEVTQLNDHFHEMTETLQNVLLDKDTLKALSKQEKKEKKNLKKTKKDPEKVKPKVFVIDFNGDIKASGVKSLKEEITAILTIAGKEDEVIVRLESAGGMVHAYGLASSQLCRIRSKGVPLTVTVDKVAASGGYMMACTADKILSAPFAVIGSIGVIAQLPNFNKILKKHDIDLEIHTAGEFKRTLTVFGENTEKDREKFKQDIEDVHDLFKHFIKEYREKVDIEKTATGEVWYGKKAVEMQLVDEIMTSDEYICQKAKEADVVHVAYVVKKSVAEKLGVAANVVIDTVLMKWLGLSNSNRFLS